MRFIPSAPTLAAAVAVVVASALPAVAQNLPAQTGPRVEVTVGLDQLRFDLGDYRSAGRAKANDLGYGVAVGYDVALSPTLIGGIEGGVKLSDIDATTGTATSGGGFRARRELDLAARLATPIGQHSLVYGKVGYANLQIDDRLTAAGITTGGKRTLDGLLLGAGAEVGITDRTYLKSEYRYTDYSRGVAGNQITTGIGFRF